MIAANVNNLVFPLDNWYTGLWPLGDSVAVPTKCLLSPPKLVPRKIDYIYVDILHVIQTQQH